MLAAPAGKQIDGLNLVYNSSLNQYDRFCKVLAVPCVACTICLLPFCADALEHTERTVFLMVKQWELPDGYDLEQVNEYADNCIRKRHREWNQRNPEKVLEQRKRTYTNFLRNHGFTVIPPDGGIGDE